jgi:hypothetical protein
MNKHKVCKQEADGNQEMKQLSYLSPHTRTCISVITARADALINGETSFQKKRFSLFNSRITIMEESPLKVYKARWV